MIVDCHAHLVPPDLLAAIRKDAAKFPNVRLIEDGGRLALRLCRRQADAAGVQAAVGYCRRGSPGWPSKASTSRWSAAGSTCSAMSCRAPKARPGARLTNDALLAAAKAEPHFVPLATVPLGDGARAAAVLKDAVKAGFAGAMIGTLPRGVGSTLDHADLDAVLAGGGRDRRRSSTSIRASMPATCG